MKFVDFSGFMTVQEAADAIKRTRQGIHDMIREGRLKGKKVHPKLWIVDKESVENFIESEGKMKT